MVTARHIPVPVWVYMSVHDVKVEKYPSALTVLFYFDVKRGHVCLRRGYYGSFMDYEAGV